MLGSRAPPHPAVRIRLAQTREVGRDGDNNNTINNNTGAHKTAAK